MIEELFSAFNKASNELKKACISEIGTMVSVNGGCIDLPTDNERCYVIYDGGNHPEYASGFRAIDRVINQNGTLYAITEDDEWEELDYFSTDDLHEIYLYVKAAN